MSRSKDKLYRMGERVLSFLFPPTCPLCREVTGEGVMGVLCPECNDLYENELVTKCPVCGGSAEECTCVPDMGNDGGDFVRRLSFFGFYTGYDEESAVARLIYSMKRVPDSAAHTFLARQMARCILRTWALSDKREGEAVVTYIPRSKSSLRKYGFDQMELIAGKVARFTGAKVVSAFARHGGEEQKALTARERQKNAEDSLFLKRGISLRGKRIILLDDVVTTGSTMKAATELLLRECPCEIFPAAAFLARTGNRPLLPEEETHKKAKNLKNY